MNKRKAKIFFSFCSPAAGGKSTICNLLAGRDATLLRSISTTTRSPRNGEADGRDYFFVSPGEFEQRAQADLFIEHAHFGGCRYGTEIRNLERAEAAGADLLLAIDVQGAAAMKERWPEQAITICVFPPSIAVLKERLRSRGTESEERFAERMKIAVQEMEVLSRPGFSDYLLINDDLEAAVQRAASIIAAERQKFSRVDPYFVQKLFS